MNSQPVANHGTVMQHARKTEKKQIMIQKIFLVPFLLFIVSSCQNFKTENNQESLCDQMNEDSLVFLKGTLNINSKDTIVFENIDKKNHWQRKIHLIPCSNDLKDYILSMYDSYLYLKNFDEKFWVSVEGKFLTSDTLESPQQFLFHFVALIDELEAITDSSHAMREMTKERLDSLNKTND